MNVESDQHIEQQSIPAVLLAELRAYDPETAAHSERVALFTGGFSRFLGMQDASLQIGAQLHDIGKTIIPLRILNSPKSLTKNEWRLVHLHPQVSREKYNLAIRDVDDVGKIISAHHEWWNGGGYPHGISGEAIPEGAQIIAFSDAFDVLTHGRLYSEEVSIDTACEIIQRSSGTHFNPQLTTEFIRFIRLSQSK